MTRALLALGAVVGVIAWLLWASSRDLRETWAVPPMPDPDDDVQWDPWTLDMMPVYALPEAEWIRPPFRVTSIPSGTGDVVPQPWVNTCQSGPIGPSA